jgi:hypothetical protein
MKNPETVLRELGDLYEFYRQIKKFKIKDQKASNKKAQSNTVPPPVVPPSGDTV